MEKTKCEVVALGWPQSLWFCLLVSQVLWPVLKWSRNSKSFCWVNQPRTLQVLDLVTLTFTIPNSGTRKYRYCCMIKLNRGILLFSLYSCMLCDLKRAFYFFVFVFRSSHHTSLDQSSPPLGGTSPTCQYTLPSPMENKDDFPLRKTGWPIISVTHS